MAFFHSGTIVRADVNPEECARYLACTTANKKDPKNPLYKNCCTLFQEQRINCTNKIRENFARPDTAIQYPDAKTLGCEL